MTEIGWWAACHALSIAFANGVDRWRNEEVLALFTEDGTLDRWGQAITGQAALRQWLEQRPVDVVTRHVCTNFEARQTVPDRVQGLTLFTFYTAPKSNGMDPVAFHGPHMVGEYLDEFHLTKDGWRIGKRTIDIVFRRTS